MTHPVTGIDHVFLLTDALDRAAEQWARLGFTITPRGHHSAHMGTANNCIMLAEDYIELLGVMTPTDANASMRASLSQQGAGLHAVACQIDDAVLAVERLAALGIAAGPVQHFARPVDLPGGATGEAAFSIAMYADKEVPRGTVFMCQQRTRETVWIPEYMTHANGARALGAVVVIDPEPATVAAGFARLYAKGAVSDLPGGCRVETGTAPILVLTPGAAEIRYPGIELSGTPTAPFAALEIVADLEKAQAAVGKLAQPVPHGLVVAPQATGGVILAFTEARP